MSLFTNVTFWPTLIVISSGIMPFGVIEIVGGPEGAGAGEDGVATGGVGDVGVVDDVPLEQAAHVRIEMSTRVRIGLRPGRDRRVYDCRSVVIGSTDAARRAGRKQASRATTASSAGTAAKVNGSSVPTP